MSTVGETVVPAESAVLTEGEVNNIMAGESIDKTPTLPSDNAEFIMPDKFQGKSAEEIARSYLALEKMKNASQDTDEGGGPKSTEGGEPSEPEEGTQPTEIGQEQYDELVNTYESTGALTEAQYAELAKAGYTKEQVEAELKSYDESKEYQQYKAEKQLNSVLEPLGGGQDKFKAVAQWANESKPEADVKAFNEALATSNVIAQQAMLRGLYAEYESAGNTSDVILHTNTPQSLPNKGYKTQEEFFKDIGSEEYKNNAAYRKAVEDKMSKSNIF